MRRLMVLAFLAGLVLMPSMARGQISVGAQGSWASKRDFGLGARATLDLSGKRVPVAVFATYDYFWPNSPPGVNQDYWELNFTYTPDLNFNGVDARPVYGGQGQTYLGLGLNVAHAKGTSVVSGEVDESTNYGLNILGGSKFYTGSLAPFFEIRYSAWSSDQLVFTIGVDLMLLMFD